LKSPLRYPGGKSRAIKLIKEYIPSDIKKLASPFLGGGSLELHFASEGVEVAAYDLFSPLCWFWKALLEEPEALADRSDTHRGFNGYLDKKKNVNLRGLSKEDFAKLKKFLSEQREYSVSSAAAFYALNRSSFSGETLSGGYSREAAHARFTDSSIQRVRDFKIDGLTVENKSFEESIVENQDAFLYCDPPYLLEKSKNNLYGNSGDMHKSFDHELLREILGQRSGWVVSYNDSEAVRKMYDGYKIVPLTWAYGMKNVAKKKMGKSSEVLILGD
tara:strand:+ start:34 stop:855 length:822 start_codon:yes stop_codon:yes gene_type:complete